MSFRELDLERVLGTNSGLVEKSYKFYTPEPSLQPFYSVSVVCAHMCVYLFECADYVTSLALTTLHIIFGDRFSL